MIRNIQYRPMTLKLSNYYNNNNRILVRLLNKLVKNNNYTHFIQCTINCCVNRTYLPIYTSYVVDNDNNVLNQINN